METHVSSGNSDGEHRQAQEKLSNTETSVQIREIATNQLLSEIRTLIESSRKQAALAVNTALVLLYWRIGRRIHIEILGEGRAEYGERVVETLSKSLVQEYGKGFSRRNLFRMIRFAEIFPDEQIVSTLSAQLSWSHFLEIIPLRDLLQRGFYAEMCRVERWSVRTLRAKIRGMLYERTAISRKPEQLARQELDTLRADDQMTPDLVFRDPYVLDFLELPEIFSEQDLESAILREIERFLLELGTDFTFVARQKRLSVGKEDFYLDLLFYHRGLRRLVAIDLKLGRFSATYKGQMELYLRWLDKYERKAWEESPIGLILCSEKDREQIELLQMTQGEIRVAEYLTELPPQQVLQAKLRAAVQTAREQFAMQARDSKTIADE
jgi:predicted nuclease of restriction endonuclease-like (RecB) superfamily